MDAIQTTGPDFNKAVVPPKIGDYWDGQGGVFAGLMRGEVGKSDYFLIVPTDPKAYHPSISWGGYEEDQSGARSDLDGLANTLYLAEIGQGQHPAACWALGLKIMGHNDFYLPAKKELTMIYANASDLFEAGDGYWSSTQYSQNCAWVQGFNAGLRYYNYKYLNGRARAVRRVSII